jgi:hypothetical protein
MQADYKDYISGAFNARPLGMFIPPNWIGLGVVGFLGFLYPGFWVLGAGLELGYLLMLSSNPRFQRIIKAKQQRRTQREQYSRLQGFISQLEPDQQQRYRALEERCRGILRQLAITDNSAAATAQGEGLRRLLWIFLRLLITRQAILRTLQESLGQGSKSLQMRITELEEKLKAQNLGDDLRKSFQSQADILRQRRDKQDEAREKLVFLEAELVRIQEQVELLREQAVISTGTEVVSNRIDHIAETLGDTTRWIKEQQQIYGGVEDLLEEPPPLSAVPMERQSQ